MLTKFYHKTIRKIVASFGTLFNDITMVKYKDGVEDSDEYERLKVPLTFANKEKFLYNLFYNETLQKPIQVQMPRMSFEMTGMSYDANRKLVSITKNYSANTINPSKSVNTYNPVPYDFFFDLNVYTRNVEDMCQILEQIVPYFTPDFTITVKLVDDRGLEIERDIPIILNSMTPQFDSDTDRDSVRYIAFNMNFTVKAYLWGPGSQTDIIRKAFAQIYDTTKMDTQKNIVMNAGGVGDYTEEEEVYSGADYQNANWRGRVINWTPSIRKLELHSISGKYQPGVGDTVTGFENGATWNIATIGTTPVVLAQSIVQPVPNTANVASANVTYSFMTTEFPNITIQP